MAALGHVDEPVLDPRRGPPATVGARAGYIDIKSGRTLAYAVMVNNAGAVNPNEVASSVSEVVTDEGTISNYLYENL